MDKLRAFLRFALINFGPAIAFFVVNHFKGLKPAILVSVIYCVAEIALRLHRRLEITKLFIYSSVITIAFGGVDLYSQHSFLLKYEPAVTNFFTGLFFAASLFADRTLIEEFADSQRKEKRPRTRDRRAYFKLLTGVWVAYFFAKALAYVWIASRYSIEESMIIRAVVGSASFYALLAISIVGSKRLFLFLKEKRLLPPADPA